MDQRASDLLVGGLAGIVGTFAMTVAKRQLYPMLDSRERYPLPPREITQGLGEKATGHRLSRGGMINATLAAHFGFGAANGLLFTLLGLHRQHAVAKGVAFGTLVWVASYFGGLPMTGVLSPATRHPARRNALMVAVHLVWGGATGFAASQLAASRGLYEGHRRQPDRPPLDSVRRSAACRRRPPGRTPRRCCGSGAAGDCRTGRRRPAPGHGSDRRR